MSDQIRDAADKIFAAYGNRLDLYFADLKAKRSFGFSGNAAQPTGEAGAEGPHEHTRNCYQCGHDDCPCASGSWLHEEPLCKAERVSSRSVEVILADLISRFEQFENYLPWDSRQDYFRPLFNELKQSLVEPSPRMCKCGHSESRHIFKAVNECMDCGCVNFVVSPRSAEARPLKVLGEDAWADEALLCKTKKQMVTLLRAFAANMKAHRAALPGQPSPAPEMHKEKL